MSQPPQRWQPQPPARGSFPLDRQGQCHELVEEYLECMRINASSIEKCRHLSKQYLECRMDRNLMAPAEWRNLGFS